MKIFFASLANGVIEAWKMDVREEGGKRQEFWKLRQDGDLGGCGEQGQQEIRDEAELALKIGKSFNSDEQGKCLSGSGSQKTMDEDPES